MTDTDIVKALTALNPNITTNDNGGVWALGEHQGTYGIFFDETLIASIERGSIPEFNVYGSNQNCVLPVSVRKGMADGPEKSDEKVLEVTITCWCSPRSRARAAIS